MSPAIVEKAIERSGPILELRDVSLSFGGIKALQGVSMSVARGRIHSIIGPNGAGKSTLINCISGVYRPKGTIRLDGSDLLATRPWQRPSRGIARTFQNIALFREESVLDNVMAGGHHRLKAGILRGALYWTRWGCRTEEALLREEAEKAMALLRIGGMGGQLARDLPYGAQKRIELARAMLCNPKVLLLDEPMAGMNEAEKTEMAEVVQQLNREAGITVLMIEHDVGVVRKMSDRVTVLDFGRKIAEGSPEEVMRDPNVRRAYLGEED